MAAEIKIEDISKLNKKEIQIEILKMPDFKMYMNLNIENHKIIDVYDIYLDNHDTSLTLIFSKDENEISHYFLYSFYQKEYIDIPDSRFLLNYIIQNTNAEHIKKYKQDNFEMYFKIVICYSSDEEEWFKELNSFFTGFFFTIQKIV